MTPIVKNLQKGRVGPHIAALVQSHVYPGLHYPRSLDRYGRPHFRCPVTPEQLAKHATDMVAKSRLVNAAVFEFYELNPKPVFEDNIVYPEGLLWINKLGGYLPNKWWRGSRMRKGFVSDPYQGIESLLTSAIGG